MKTLASIVDSSQVIVIIQADNPDGDSLASALALELLLAELGKEPVLYCGVEIPGYLRYMDGWDRVVHELPQQFDASIIVDTSAIMLLEMLQKSGELSWVKSKPSIIIDHHNTEPTIDFAEVTHVSPAVSTTEVIYELSKELGWNVSKPAADMLAYGILSDSLGLISEATSARSIHILADLVEIGVSLAALDNKRRAMSRKQPEVLAYKGLLLQRINYSENGSIATVQIPWSEIEKYSHLYNPSVLVLDEMRQVEGVALAVAFKIYPDGRITGKIRANYGYRVADKLAEHFGGGGHVYASGFRVTDGRKVEELRSELIDLAEKLIDELSV